MKVILIFELVRTVKSLAKENTFVSLALRNLIKESKDVAPLNPVDRS